MKWVKVTGVVVGVDEYEKKTVFTLDDSSGACIECTVAGAPVVSALGISRHWDQLANIQIQEEKKGRQGEVVKKKVDNTPSVLKPVVPWGDIDIGTVVRVKGKIGSWWDKYQVEAVMIEVVRGLDAEVKGWNEMREFKANVLGKPWVLTMEEEEKCRRARDRELRRAVKRGGDDRGKGKNCTERLDRNGRNVEVRKDRPSRNGYDGELKKRKDLERVQKLDGVVTRRKETEAEQLASRRRSEALSLAMKAAAGKYDALGL